ncbi:MAG: hypothetical protein A3F70_09805 [Acidobacteria bacterium RIFCSPLOWO2_12_FULL_67_14]|nr:MAG: hypothetical protein A3H29_00015 [Acidobacteria bacterium RIFCSPLOWO2_02_FULL_67_21]OFW38046.1 MAG: hypothetical protein A3F70_09805 [Acidobacteria bacterium RIFCSPLOWO2_12_FULL_67_14]
MRILAVHNRYQKRGGEDAVFDAETALLERFGHQVTRHTADNAQIADSGRAALAARAIWNGQAQARVRDLIRAHRPDIMHVHNTLALISPAIYSTATAEGVAVVQSLHNYRLLCPSATFYRDGGVCEACLGRLTAWPGVIHGCYRQSHTTTAVVAAISAAHHMLGTWHRNVDRYIVLSEFAKRKFEEGRALNSKFVVKPNFIDPDPGVGRHDDASALFVGRLVPEKGLGTLVAAAARVRIPNFLLKVIGEGPMRADAHPDVENVEWLGPRSRADVYAVMKASTVLVFPSEWYECCPMTILEAFATGLPVIASRLGAMPEIVHEGVTGLLFEPKNPDDLARRIEWVMNHPAEIARMGCNARAEFQANYTADRNYRQLMRIYEGAISSRRGYTGAETATANVSSATTTA